MDMVVKQLQLDWAYMSPIMGSGRVFGFQLELNMCTVSWTNFYIKGEEESVLFERTFLLK